MLLNHIDKPEPLGRVGASLSGLAAGVIVDHFGYSAAFLAAGGVAFVALAVFSLQMPETAERDSDRIGQFFQV